MNGNYKECKKCVMDTSDKNIIFNKDGICNHCLEAEGILESIKIAEEESNKMLKEITNKIRKDAKNNEYDSIIGLSGGVDSSYVAYIAKKYGLNPLAVHFDNGWNSEIAVSNIKNIVDICKFDLETYVINWKEFRDLQRSFLKAGVVDIEMLTDHAISAAIFKIAKKHNVKYILTGSNKATEHGMPKSWVHRKQDFKNIKSIHKKFGEVPLKTYPHTSTLEFYAIKFFGLGLTNVDFLNKLIYKKNDVIKVLEKELKWKNYGGKHYESIFTKFYQAYILPNKFNMDKRRVHLSALIRNQEISREEAIIELQKLIYKEEELKIDKEYVLKKLGFTNKEFDTIMTDKPCEHLDYGSDENYVKYLKKIYYLIKG